MLHSHRAWNVLFSLFCDILEKHAIMVLHADAFLFVPRQRLWIIRWFIEWTNGWKTLQRLGNENTVKCKKFQIVSWNQNYWTTRTSRSWNVFKQFVIHWFFSFVSKPEISFVSKSETAKVSPKNFATNLCCLSWELKNRRKFHNRDLASFHEFVMITISFNLFPCNHCAVLWYIFFSHLAQTCEHAN